MTKILKTVLMIAGLVALAYAGPSQAAEVTGFGPSFTNKAPAALDDAVSDPLIAQDDNISAEGLNEIAPAAGDPHPQTTDSPDDVSVSDEVSDSDAIIETPVTE